MTTTLEGLRINQWGVEAVAAQGVLTVAVQPTATDQFVIGTTTYTIVASGASTPGQINRGADLAAAKVNIVAAINGTDGWNTAHPLVSAAAFSGDNCTITARHPGPAGDDIVFTESFTSGSNLMNGSGTLGGTTAGAFARGTAVAATSKIAIENLVWDDADDAVYHPQLRNGLMMRNRGVPVETKAGTGFSFPDQPVVWEQLPHWLSMLIDGDVIPSVESGPVYRWQFVRDPAAVPTPHSFTQQRRFNDGLGGTVDQRIAYGMLREMTFKYALGEPLKMSGAGFARVLETSAITNSLSLPTAELAVSSLSKGYLNDSWATLGNTQLSGMIIGWELKFTSGFMPVWTADQRADLDFHHYQLNHAAVTVEAKVMLLMDPTEYAAEAVHAKAQDLRAVRLNVIGTSNRALTFDALMRHRNRDIYGAIATQDGQDIVTLDLVESSDGTNLFKATLDHPTVGTLN